MASSDQAWFCTAAAGTAAVTALSLVALQSDACSRKLLSSQSLHAKRHASYRHAWSRAFASSATRIQQQQQVLTATTLKLVHRDDWQDLLDHLLQVGTKSRDGEKIDTATYRIVRIGRDSDNDSSDREFYLWLQEEQSSVAALYQLPLVAFCNDLADRFDDVFFHYTLCIVCDASAGHGLHVLDELVKIHNEYGDMESKNSTRIDNSKLLQRPSLWLLNLAALLTQPGLLTQDQSERILESLVRLQQHFQSDVAASTRLVSIPAVAVPILLPLAQRAFPDDRHVFVYSGCVAANEYAVQPLTPTAQASDTTSAASFDDTAGPTPVLHTTPMSGNNNELLHSSSVMTQPYLEALQQLPLQQASCTETWMAAIHAFLTLKEQEVQTGYIPYVCRLEYLLDVSNAMDNDSKRSDQYWSIRSLLQFISGTRSRQTAAAIAESATIAACIRWATQDEQRHRNRLSPTTCNSIANVVFAHKQILIESKIIKDTVAPQEHWTLKAKVKRGCACCVLEAEVEEVMNETNGNGASLFVVPTTTRITNNSTTGYVNGTTGFAFDPTRFG